MLNDITVADQLAAVAAAERAGYSFDASNLVAVTSLEYEFIDDNTGYHYFVDVATGTVSSNAPWQTRS